VKNEEYQILLESIARKYSVKPSKVADFPHLEIAAIFLAYCNNYFLRENGKLAFVLPRSFFNASQHDNTRSGRAKGFKINQIWDLANISPLFRIPACVLFTEKANDTDKRTIPANGLKSLSLKGNLPHHNCNYLIARENISESPALLYYSLQGNSSAFSTIKHKKQSKLNPYKSKFKQGATIVPRTFYFIELCQDIPDDFKDSILNIKTANDIKPDAKDPWKKIDFSGRIESRFIFRTALSKSILPFALLKPNLVTLPISIEIDNVGNKYLKLFSADEIMDEGYLNASRWFRNAENIWNIHKTEKSKNMSARGRLDFQKGITDQNLNAPYLVLYNSSAKDANATLLKRATLDLEFIVESVAYVLYTAEENEAYYLTTILNSTAPNKLMKDFQAKGLFGARHVHKKILDVYFPKFDQNNEDHHKLVKLGKTCHEKTDLFLKSNPPNQPLNSVNLGRLRLDIKKNLNVEIEEIDLIVTQIERF
jgi:hypothetical protein